MLKSFNTILHADHSHGALSELLCDKLGGFGRFLDEVLLVSVIDTLKLLLFLFATYLLMEFIEHKASDKAERLIKKAGKLGSLAGGALGAMPQCGFSAAAANLYTGGVVTAGTVVAVFLSTSDEMLPVLLAGEVRTASILLIIVYKILVGILVGLGVDLFLSRTLGKRDVHIEDMCESDGCHCEGGILRSALHHTVKVGLFIFLVTFLVGALVFFVGEDGLLNIIPKVPVISHLVVAILGLIPNCATSVVITRLALGGIITHGTMISGLLSGAGVGLLVLFRVNKSKRENLIILLILVLAGTVFGFIADFIPFLSVTV
jgi:hypothetical protein